MDGRGEVRGEGRGSWRSAVVGKGVEVGVQGVGSRW